MADDRLSRAASGVWRIEQNAWMEYAMDGSGDCGEMIGRSLNNAKLRAVREQGFTPDGYNAELRNRLCADYPKMSHGVHCLLATLEVEDEETYRKNNTFVYTCGEWSSLAYLEAGW